MYAYTVHCRFDLEDIALHWVQWLRDGHLADVIAAGALSAEIVRVDSDAVEYEVRYRFASREAFDNYVRDHALRLRAAGVARFPLELGLHYTRSSGEIVHEEQGDGHRARGISKP